MHTHMTGPMWMPTAPPTLGRLLAWHPQPLPIEPLACLLALVAVRARPCGGCGGAATAWPLHRTLLWAAGVLSVAAVTCTGINGYGMGMFSVHMVQHMVLSMLSPILLLLGAPVTLALRALPTAGQGRTGPRETVAWLAAQPSGPGDRLPASSLCRCSSPASTGSTSPRCSTSSCAAGSATSGCSPTSWRPACCSSGRSSGVDPAPRRPSHLLRCWNCSSACRSTPSSASP